jgi:VWFA-related protein
MYRPCSRLCLLAVTLGLALSLAPAAAQRPPASQAGPPQVPAVQLSANVRVVLVDAVVLDERGRFVTDLRREEVEVREDGRTQTMAGFELISLPAEPLSALTSGAVPTAPVDTQSNARPFDGRIYFVVLDDLHISPQRTNLARRLARQFIERQVRSGDLAMVLATSGNRTAAQGFTSDKARLLRAVDACVGRKIISPALATLAQSGTPEEGTRGTADPQRAYNARTAFEALSQLAAFAGTVRQRRKALVLIGEGADYDLESQDTSARELRGSMRDFVGAANRANLTIYPFDPRVFTNSGDDFVDIASTPPGDMESGSEKIKSTAIQDDGEFAQDNLRTLAAETGGFADVTSRDFAGAFDRIRDENSHYYMIGYYPTNDAKDGEFRAIDVRVSRPGLTVRARRGYTPAREVSGRGESTGAAAKAAAPGVSPQLQRALEAALPVTGLTLRGTAAPFRGTAEKASVAVIVQASGRDLLFTPRDGKFEDTVELAAVALDGRGRAQGGTRQTVTMPLSQRSVATVERTGVVFQLRLDLAPGPYQLRIAARDSGTGVAGSVHYDLDVPDFAKLPLSLSGLVLSAELAGQIPSPQPDAELDRWLPATPVTQRGFAAADTLTAIAAVYAAGAASAQPVEVTTTVLGAGDEVCYQHRDRYEVGAGRSPRDAVMHRATIPLGGMRPGSYTLRVKAARDGAPADQAVFRELAFAVR